MANTYFYKAKDRAGQLLTGSILADNETAVALHIRGKGCFVLQIKEQSSADGLLGSLRYSLHPVNSKDLAVICRLFATMIGAGVPLIAALNVLIEQTSNSRLKAAILSVYKKINEGEAFSQALAEHPRVFPAIMVNMIEAGEVGGVLDDVLDRLAIHFEKEHRLNEKVKSAMTYPIIVICMAILAVGFIISFVMPTFMDLFAAMNVEIPWTTKMLLALSGFLSAYWSIVMIAVGVLLIVVRVALTKPSIRLVVDQTILVLPLIGSLARKVAIARFSRTFSTLIHGGVPIITALEVVKKTVGNLSLMDALTKSQASVKEGIGLAATLGAGKIFSPMLVQMVAIGEECGTMDKMLEKVADFYESDVDDMVNRLGSVIEPLIVGLLGVVIGFIVISVVSPLFDVITGVGNTTR